MKEIKDLYRAISIVYKTISQEGDPWCKTTCPENKIECFPYPNDFTPDGPWTHGACAACQRCNDFYDNQLGKPDAAGPYCKVAVLGDDGNQTQDGDGNPVWRPRTLEEIIEALRKNGACKGCYGDGPARLKRERPEKDCLAELAAFIQSSCQNREFEGNGNHTQCGTACDECEDSGDTEGACCVRTNPQYPIYDCQSMFKSGCLAGEFNMWGGDGSSCNDDGSCPGGAASDQGACCNDDGTCSVTARSQCFQYHDDGGHVHGGIFRGVGTTCEEVNCGDTGSGGGTGCCCYNGRSLPRITEAECGQVNGTWNRGEKCKGPNDIRCGGHQQQK